MAEREHRGTWEDKALLVVLGAVAAYSIGLVVAGGLVDRALFEALGLPLASIRNLISR